MTKKELFRDNCFELDIDNNLNMVSCYNCKKIIRYGEYIIGFMYSADSEYPIDIGDCNYLCEKCFVGEEKDD